MHVALITLIIILIILSLEVAFVIIHMLIIWSKIFGPKRHKFMENTLNRFALNETFMNDLDDIPVVNQQQNEKKQFQAIASSFKTVSGFSALYCPKELLFLGLSISIYLIFFLVLITALDEDDLDLINKSISNSYVARYSCKIIGFFSIGFIGIFPTIFVENKLIFGKRANENISFKIHILVMTCYIILPSTMDIWQSIELDNNILVWDILNIVFFITWITLNTFKNFKIQDISTKEDLITFLSDHNVLLVMNFISELLLIVLVSACYIYRLFIGFSNVSN